MFQISIEMENFIVSNKTFFDIGYNNNKKGFNVRLNLYQEYPIAIPVFEFLPAKIEQGLSLPASIPNEDIYVKPYAFIHRLYFYYMCLKGC